ncbi:hypothetical protein KC19_VG261200 [Ceratodon purpureus]|uniref:Uncharacterized protein n=1 Tax=Ceratodon purpureus TaxID=3225 RepID=A0A8T0HUL1_CERPU|nr:hypothetical protein KC19_VG261200 [Ceratodon purpureus]
MAGQQTLVKSLISMRSSVMSSGNGFQSHQPKIFAACVYHRYRQRSSTPKSPRQFHLLGRGCERSMVTSSSCTARETPASLTPCQTNQLFNSPTKETRLADFADFASPMYAPSSPDHAVKIEPADSLNRMQHFQYSYAAKEPTCTKFTLHLPPSPPNSSTVQRGCHRCNNCLRTTTLARHSLGMALKIN